MKHIGTQDFLIYFDSTRVDPYVLDFSTNLGLSADSAQASITMLNADSLEKWKAYLTEVRIFVKSPFTGKYRQVFTGDIMGTNGSESRKETGRVTYEVAGSYSWLDIPVPLYLKTVDNLNVLRRFQLQAQNIDIDTMNTLLQNRQELYGTDKTVEEIIRWLFEVLDQGYSDIAKDDTAFGFKTLFQRFKVMSDIDPRFRDKGFLDLMTFTQSTTIRAFYDYLNQLLSQMMLEFYEDIDGSFRIKGPSWNDEIPYGHIFDESVIDNISKGTNWNQQPTRILTIGGKSEILEASSNGTPIDGLSTSMSIPVGLYINGGNYYGMHFDSFLKDGVMTGGVPGGAVSGFYDDLSAKKVYPNATYLNKEYERLKINGGKPHYGTDYYMSYETLNSQGVDGFVEEVRVITGGGNSITIKQVILGVTYYMTYMHLNALPSFKKGDPIRAGQKIGTTGGSGIGPPHLHFQVWKGGFDWANQRALTVDPEKFLKEMAGKVAKSEGTSGSYTSTGVLPGVKDYTGPNQTSNGYQSGMKARLEGMAKHDKVIADTCAKFGFNPMIVKVIGAIESSGNASAVGVQTKYGKAIGLLQIIPDAVGVSGVSAERLKDPAYSVEIYCRAMTEKMKTMKRLNLPQNARNAAHFWYGYTDGGRKYADAFAEIYEGFPGLSRNDSITGNYKSGNSTPQKSINVGPLAPTNSSSLARNLIQATQVAAMSVSSVEDGGSGSGSSPSTSNGMSFLEGTAGASVTSSVDGKAVVAPAGTAKQKFVLPSGRGWYATVMKDNGNGLDINLIWGIIKATSNFNQSFDREDGQKIDPERHIGLMGVPLSYLEQNGISADEAKDPAKNIYYGTKLYKECFQATRKHSFAMLAYQLGGGGLGIVNELKESAMSKGLPYSFDAMLHLIEGIYDPSRKGYYLFDYNNAKFTNVSPPIQQTLLGWAQGAIDNYCALHGGNYIKGDPHRAFKNTPIYSARPSRVVIGLDPAGGGPQDMTANGLSEKTLTLDVSNRIISRLDGNPNADIVRSRTSDEQLTLAQRASRLRSKGAVQSYRIQFATGGSGITVYRQVNGPVGSQTLQARMVSFLTPVAKKHNLPMNGARTADSAFLKGMGDSAAIIIEIGHLDKEKDAVTIRSTSYLEDISSAIGDAIVNSSNVDGSQGIIDSAPESDTEFPDFFEKYKPQLSAEEKKYRMRFMALEMELIRAGGETGGDLAAAEGYLEQFSRYMMHVLRARATGLTVSCNAPMPQVRPGFNAWLEPTRRNKVFYVTGVQHVGAFRSGVRTTVNGAYLRDIDDYDAEIDNNLFISKINYSAKDLVPTIAKGDMKSVIKDLQGIAKDSPVIEYGTSEYLRNLYNTPERPDMSIVQGEWNSDMTPSEILEKITERFKTAPPVVDERRREVTAAFQGARNLYDEFLRGK